MPAHLLALVMVIYLLWSLREVNLCGAVRLDWVRQDFTGRRRWTPVDAGGCRWTPVDAGGRRWTPVDVGGRLWTPVAAGVNERESKFACGKEEKKKINICIILNIYNQRDACRVEGRNKTKRTRKIRRKVVHKNKKKGGEEKKPSLKDSNHAITYKKDKSPFYYLPEKTDWWLRAFDAFAPWSLGDGLSGEFSINADLYLCVCSSGRY